MELTSVIIPARNERFLDNTLHEIQDKFVGDFEIIVNIDGYDEPIKEVAGVTYILNKEPIGMRPGINKAVSKACGKYILKIDAHCIVDAGMDTKLIAEHRPNWVQIPRRKRMDPHKWVLTEDGRPDVDYEYLGDDMVGRVCGSKNLDPELKLKLLDDTETFQGSCYFMEKDYFHSLGLMSVENFGTFANEAQEIGLQVFRDGGRIVRNKKTWYAHPHMGRRYVLDTSEVQKAKDYVIKLKEEYGYKTQREIQAERAR